MTGIALPGRFDEVVRIAANLGVGATTFDTAAQVGNVETIPVVGVILTR